jgi:hypothetical protein
MPFRRTLLALTTATCLTVACSQKRYVEFTLKNNSGEELATLEVDYPGGSFGKTRIAPGEIYHYRFKSLHDGQLKLSFESAQHKMLESSGPGWRENQSGQIDVIIDGSSHIDWQARHE